MRTTTWLWVLLVAGVCTWLQGAEDDESKTPAQVAEETGERSTISGKFRLDRTTLNDGKPLPKVIGMLTEKEGLTYFLIVEDKGFEEVLASSDGKTLTLCGKVVRIQDEGLFMLVDAKITRPVPPTARRKRGGL